MVEYFYMFPQHKPTVDLVIPVFDEADIIEQIYSQIRVVIDSLQYDFHVLFVDDGSSDGTADALRAISASDPRVTVLSFSRNFGHQAALTAGSVGAVIDLNLHEVAADRDHVPHLTGDPAHRAGGGARECEASNRRQLCVVTRAAAESVAEHHHAEALQSSR